MYVVFRTADAEWQVVVNGVGPASAQIARNAGGPCGTPHSAADVCMSGSGGGAEGDGDDKGSHLDAPVIRPAYQA